MPKIAYVRKRFRAASLRMIATCNTIIDEYTAQGFDLTLRQLYYQCVSRDLIPNNQTEYKNLGELVNNARLAGLIDWDSITDRTRNLRGLSHWSTPGDIMRSAASSYNVDLWATQDYRPEVWIEKDALAGVFERVCNQFDVPFFSCRGYTSQSEMWSAGQRLARWAMGGHKPIVLHFGDHDPSGMDMSRDITDRLRMFTGGVPVERLALNMDQVERYEPPPNPAKMSDARAVGYVQEFGDSSWELDALDPATLAGLVRNRIEQLIDRKKWDEAVARQERQRATLTAAADRWDEVAALVSGPGGGRTRRPPRGRGGDSPEE